MKFWQKILKNIFIGQSNPSAYKSQHTHLCICIRQTKPVFCLFLQWPWRLFFLIALLCLTRWQKNQQIPEQLCTKKINLKSLSKISLICFYARLKYRTLNFYWVKHKHKSSFVSEMDRSRRGFFFSYFSWGRCCEEESLQPSKHQEWNHCTVVTLHQIPWTNVFMPFCVLFFISCDVSSSFVSASWL